MISKPSNDKQLTGISPLEGTPAWNVGIRAGDVISQIEGVDTLDMTIDDALRRLKGPKGTKVSITVNGSITLHEAGANPNPNPNPHSRMAPMAPRHPRTRTPPPERP